MSWSLVLKYSTYYFYTCLLNILKTKVISYILSLMMKIFMKATTAETRFLYLS